MLNIDARHWPVISALFDEALELQAPELARWLDALPPDRQVHRPTLELLLLDRAHVLTQDFLSSPAKLGGDASASPGSADTGDRVGPYRLQRELGRGGMGTVWLADRSDGLLTREVALKLPHPGLATRAFAERLRRERDILASLAHPNIARLYDAGVTADGQPYMALEYVQGLTLIEHCQQRGLDLRQRIALFQQVLGAVQYAHTHLVIHRDLKPSNVLVDDGGHTHLLDFGIAKLLVDGQANVTDLTLGAGQALTPDYASPEQIASRAVTTASDVYSLGVLLFELLAGARPYRLVGAGPVALTRSIDDVDVASPSSVARGLGELTTARALRGDLDTIVLKALKKDPAERYATADAFSRDLQSFLDGAPVSARPDSLVYRWGKLVRRHRLGVAAAAVIVLSLGVGLVATVWQARRATQQAERAQAVQEFLIGLFEQVDPIKAQGQQLTAQQMLERGQRAVQVKLNDQPRLKALLSGVLATLYDKMDNDASALPLAESRVELARRLDGPRSLEYGDALFQLADIQSQLDLQASQALFLQARDVLARYPRERTGELLRIEGSIAYLLGSLGRFKESAQVLRRALPGMEAHFGPRSWEAVHNKGLLLYADTQIGDQEDATRLINEIEPLLDGTGADHLLDTAVVRGNLAMAALQLQRPDLSERQARRALADFDRVLGPDARQTLNIRRFLAAVLEARGQYEQSAQAYLTVMADTTRALGPDHPSTRLCESTSVEALIMTGRVELAEKVSRHALSARDGPDLSPDRRRAFENRLGLALVFAGKPEEAATLLAATADRSRQAHLENDDDHARNLLFLAGALLRQGRFGDAARFASEAAAVLAAEPGHHDLLLADAEMTEALASSSSPEHAQALLKQAKAHLESGTDEQHPARLVWQVVQAQASATPSSADLTAAAEARARLKTLFGAVLPSSIPVVF